MVLLEYIKDQLLFKDIVTLPGLGSFEIRKSPSRIEKKIIIPPTVQVIFNSERSLDDGILAKSIAAAEEIPEEEAQQKVLEYIDEILFALNKGEEFVFEGFGILYRDSENVFRFEKDPAYQIEFKYYGLESFELDPIENSSTEGFINESTTKLKQIDENEFRQTTKAKDKVPSIKEEINKEIISNEKTEMTNIPEPESASGKENKNNRNIFWILAGAVMIILVSFVLIKMSTTLLDGNGLSVFHSGKNDKSALFPEDENEDFDSKFNEELGEAIDSMTLQENALTIQEESEPQDREGLNASGYNEFHIIAGSFKDKVNAGILQQELTLKGYPALVIQQGEKLYRVSALSFKNKDQGLQELSRFKQKTKNNAAWLLKLQ